MTYQWRHLHIPDVTTLPLAVRGLLDLIPEAGTPWPEQQREMWFDALRATFPLFYPAPRVRRALSEIDLIARRAGDDSGR
jgi:hypothetical protein